MLKSQLNFKTIKKEYPAGNNARLEEYYLNGFTPLMLLFFGVFHQVPTMSKMHPKTKLQICKLLVDHGAD